MNNNCLEVNHVSKVFVSGFFNRRELVAVDDVLLKINLDEPRTVSIAGESGSGKTTLAQMVLGFLTPNKGQILFQGEDVFKLDSNEFLKYRSQVQAVFQNPFDAFNPFYKVDHVFDAPIRRYKLASTKNELRKIMEDALHAVRLEPADTLGRYPHQLSGGQLQRIMIARALLLKPKLIIADEPVSMIDVSLRAIVLDVIVSLKKEFGISLLYITHDLSTALQISDDLLVMYKGSVVERGNAEEIIREPKHPYTQLLVKSIPLPDPQQRWSAPLDAQSRIELEREVPTGCKFVNRCPFRMDICDRERPLLFSISSNRQAACYLYK
jgi:oligopeptide/dipeptide ABC transporter ATP-binding protein